MPMCAVNTCWKSSVTTGFTRERVTFHKFPSDPMLMHQWVKAIQRITMTPNKSSFVCSTHFTDDCFEMIDDVQRLRSDAVPTLHLPRICFGAYSDDGELPNEPLAVAGPSKENDPEFDRVNEAFAGLEAYLLKARMKPDIETIFRVLREKGLIHLEMEEFLRSIGLENKHIAVPRRQNKRQVVGRRQRPEYSAQLKVFALEMVCYSPECYEFIRNNFETRFPPTRVVNRWFTFNSRKGEFCASVEITSEEDTTVYHFSKMI